MQTLVAKSLLMFHKYYTVCRSVGWGRLRLSIFIHFYVALIFKKEGAKCVPGSFVVIVGIFFVKSVRGLQIQSCSTYRELSTMIYV
jgi:hypothetical protein